MLYPRSQEPTLEDGLFRQPGSEYRGAPFWAWNCRLDKEELLWQLEVLKKMGMGGAHMHVRTGMATEYLGQEHMAMVKACVEKCRQEGMRAWLYDEDRWPSGAAGGIATREKKYRARFLLLTPTPYGQGQVVRSRDSSSAATRSENGTLLACYDVVLDEQGCLVSFRRIGPDQPQRGTRWYAYLETPGENPWFNHQTYVNTLDPEAIARFIQVTYERYLETVGEDFGSVVPAIFTDEPQFSRKQTLDFAEEKKDVVLPWTLDLPETFRAAYGEDILERLPELLWELPHGQISTVRYHYHDHTCQRFTEAFADQCGQWCARHGLMLTGHMMEEPTLQSQTCALGEAMRSYRSFQLPGIDMLCNGTEFTTAKQAQSASRQFGREGVVSELYGVTGWDFDFRGHKFQGDWQAALGVTVRVPHLSWVSMEGEAKRDYPASIHYQSPWWQDYAYVEDHFARANTALTRGSALVRVGVIHPVESYWIHFGPSDQTNGVRAQLDRGFQDLTQWLLRGSVDFDFISESLLPDQCPAGGAPLRVGEMFYDAVLVPGCHTLRSSTLERLEAFQKAGGRLIFLGAAPEYENAVPSPRGKALWERSQRVEFAGEAVLAALESVRLVELREDSGKRTDSLIHQLRRDGEDRWLFIAHADRPYHRDIPQGKGVRIGLEGAWDVLKYDTLTGDIQPMASEFSRGRTQLHTVLYDLDSLLLRFIPRGSQRTEPASGTCAWTALPVPKRVEYTLDEPNAYLLDKAEFALDGGPWQEEAELLRADNILRAQLGWPDRQGAVSQPWTVRETEAEHSAALRFRVFCDRSLEGLRLALENGDRAQILVNGVPVVQKPEGWYVDKAIQTVPLPPLRAGENTIQVQTPITRRVGLEWCYLLGSFGVRVAGEYRELTAPAALLGFDDVVHQGLAHYGGNITYHIPFTSRGGRLRVQVPHYAGAAVRAELEGGRTCIAYPPYRAELGQVLPGTHILKLTLLGNRQNSFGPVHLADTSLKWQGPNSWRSSGESWTESYRLRPLGILSAPVLEESEP